MHPRDETQEMHPVLMSLECWGKIKIPAYSSVCWMMELSSFSCSWTRLLNKQQCIFSVFKINISINM